MTPGANGSYQAAQLTGVDSMTDEPIALLSLVLTLRAEQPAGAPSSLGRAAHAVLLDAIGQTDPALAESIHAGTGVRPFTVSNLIGFRRRDGVRPEQAYTLRFTALTAPVSAALMAASRGGPLSAGAILRLDSVPLQIESVAMDAAAHPWAGHTTYEALAAPWLLGKLRPETRLQLRFVSATTFKSHDLHVPVPLPGLVFGSLLERWNAFAPMTLPVEVRRFADECLALSQYRLNSRPVLLKDGGLRIGATGQAQYTATNHDRYWLSLINLLAQFASYAGVGVGTTMGMGQCHLVRAERQT